MIGPAMPCCGRVMPSNAAVAVGRFRPDGPLGYMALDTPNAPLRATRAEAEQDYHYRVSPQCVKSTENYPRKMPRNLMIGYYVSVINGKRRALLLGPYDDHASALADIGEARRIAETLDPFAWGYEFGTARVENPTLPEGRFNGATPPTDVTARFPKASGSPREPTLDPNRR